MGYVEAMSKQLTCCNGTIGMVELIPRGMRNDSSNGLLYSEEYIDYWLNGFILDCIFSNRLNGFNNINEENIVFVIIGFISVIVFV